MAPWVVAAAVARRALKYFGRVCCRGNETCAEGRVSLLREILEEADLYRACVLLKRSKMERAKCLHAFLKKIDEKATSFCYCSRFSAEFSY